LANPKLEETGAGRPLPLGLQRLVEAPATTAILRAAGLLAALAVLLVAAVGPDPATSNFAPTWVYVWFWVGLVPASLLLGPVWKALNPLRALSWIEARMTGVKEEPERSLPAGLGYWPAAGGLAAFVWLELVYQDAAKPVTVLIFLLLYGLVQLIGASYFGMRWYERCDGFEVYSTLVGRLCPFGRRDDGRLVVRNPLRGLAGLEPGPGLVAVVAVLLGSTGFDGLSRPTAWTDLTQDASVISALLIGTAGLASAIAFVALTFYVAIASSRKFARSANDRSAHGLPGRFVHSLVPIVIGYTVAHYFSLLVFQGQAGYILASDPLGGGQNLFGTADWAINYTAVSTSVIALVQVGAIVIGHVVGVVSAHDRAVGVFSGRNKTRGQYSLLAVMVAYSVGGIALLVGT